MTSPASPAPATTSGRVAAAIAEGQRHHGAGAFEAAENAYLAALDADPENADALHLLGILHFQTGRADSAAELIDAAIEQAPAVGQYRYSKGVLLQELGRLDEAVDAYRDAAARNPQHPESRFNQAVALQALGRNEEAAVALEETLAVAPGHVPALVTLGNLYTAARRFDDALALYDRARAAVPTDGRLHLNAANVLTELHRLDEAADAAREAAQCAPDNADIQVALGRNLQAVGDIAGAVEAYAASHRLRRAEAETADDPWMFAETTKSKLHHDTEQIGYLAGKGVAGFDAALEERFEDVLAELPVALENGSRIPLTEGQRNRIGAVYNRPLHIADAPMVAGGAINPALDTAAITDSYFANEPGICFFDDFLKPEALESLRRFCLESTIWYDFSHQEGYLGAYREDGFAAPLILQIAEDLRHALPEVIKGLPVRHLWAYKYDSRMTGIATHADFAAVNVNFWITPDDANLDPDSGGLVVHKAECPLDWTFEDYNSADKTRTNAYIEAHSKGSVVVPHRQNRVVLFNSDLFHATDEIRFREGYENRRINITILYGERHYDG